MQINARAFAKINNLSAYIESSNNLKGLTCTTHDLKILSTCTRLKARPGRFERIFKYQSLRKFLIALAFIRLPYILGVNKIQRGRKTRFHHVTSSYLSPQLKLMIIHIFTCIFTIYGYIMRSQDVISSQ